MIIHRLEMALSTQMFLLCFFLCSLVAECYFFDLNLFDNYDQRIPLGLPNPFGIYPGMFDYPRTQRPQIRRKDSIRKHNNANSHLISDVTTERITTTDPSATESIEVEDISDENADLEVNNHARDYPENFLMKNVKVNEPWKWPDEEIIKVPAPNELSIHSGVVTKPEPILSVTVSDDKEEVKFDPEISHTEETIPELSNTNESKDQVGNSGDPGISKQSDFLLVPVTAVNPSNIVQIPNGNMNPVAPMANVINTPPINNNLGTSPLGTVIQPLNNMNMNNPNQLNQGIPYGNQPNQFLNVGYPTLQPFVNAQNQMNLAPNNLYALVNVPNGQGVNMPNNLFYLVNQNPSNMGIQIPSQQAYNLVRVDNLGNANQPINVMPYNNQANNYIPYNPQNSMPMNNQPNNYIPLYNNNNNYVPMNGQLNNVNTNNFLPLNNQANYVPNTDQSNNFVPVNNNNFVPLNNQANIVSLNNQPHNIVPLNNQPLNNNLVPINNQPNNVLLVNNPPTNLFPLNNDPNIVQINNDPNNFNPQLNNFVPFNTQTNVPINNPGVNIVPYNTQPSNVVTLNQQPNNIMLTPSNIVPVLIQTPPNTIALLTMKDKDEKDDKEKSEENDKASEKESSGILEKDNSE